MSKIKDPSVKQNKKKLPLHPFELVWYILCGLVGVWGLTYIVLGLVAENLPIKTSGNEYGLVEANETIAKTFGLDFLGWGLIILAIAAVAVVIVLLLFSNKVDRDYEKNVRRAQRLAQLEAEVEKEELSEWDEIKKQSQKDEVIDAKVEEKPADEPKEEQHAEEVQQEQPKEEPVPEVAPEENKE